MPLFELRSYKSLDGSIFGKQWYNSYILEMPGITTALAANQKIMSFCVAEAFMHLDVVNIKRVTLRELRPVMTDIAEGSYDVWHPNIWGTRFRDVTDDVLSDEWGIQIKRNTPYGRMGASVWRGTLTKREIDSAPGVRSTLLINNTAINDGWFNWTRILDEEGYIFWTAPKWTGWDILGPTRPVMSFQISSVIRLASLTDAQFRKSSYGQEAKTQAYLGCQYLAHMAQIIRQNAINSDGDVLFGDMVNLLPYNIQQGTHCAFVKEYFEHRATVSAVEDGATGFMMDPHINIARVAADGWHDRLEALSTELNTVMGEPRLVIPGPEILGVRLMVLAASRYAEITLLSRFL